MVVVLPVDLVRSPVAILPDGTPTLTAVAAPAGPSWATVAVEKPRNGSARVQSTVRSGRGRGFIPVSCAAASINVKKEDSDQEIENNVKVFMEHVDSRVFCPASQMDLSLLGSTHFSHCPHIPYG
ncbi:hypothetical protein SUGI_0865830 [Cryptomeria japonica]|nr:hypothetical protein SUGI_0865830 [Cryptomeria japonica]